MRNISMLSLVDHAKWGKMFQVMGDVGVNGDRMNTANYSILVDTRHGDKIFF